jgi:hypothetical protein
MEGAERERLAGRLIREPARVARWWVALSPGRSRLNWLFSSYTLLYPVYAGATFVRQSQNFSGTLSSYANRTHMYGSPTGELTQDVKPGKR